MPQPRHRNVSLKPAQRRGCFNGLPFSTRANQTQLLLHRRRRSQHHSSRRHRVRRVRSRRGTLPLPRWRRVKAPFNLVFLSLVLTPTGTAPAETPKNLQPPASEKTATTTSPSESACFSSSLPRVQLVRFPERTRKSALTRSRCLWSHPHGDIHAGQVQPIPHRPQAIRHRRHHLNRVRPRTRPFSEIPFRHALTRPTAVHACEYDAHQRMPRGAPV